MAQYLVESPHTKEECLRALDEIVDKEPELLDETYFGCIAGEHTGYMTVEAGSEAEARDKLPGFLKDKAHVVQVGKFTREQIESFHQK